MMNNKTSGRFGFVFYKFLLLEMITVLVISCNRDAVPKPRGYFRIDFPEKTYQTYQSDCNYRFEYPAYGTIAPYSGSNPEPCWLNIEFPRYKGTIYLTYKSLNDDLGTYAEDIRTLAYKHIVKADDIQEKPFYDPDRKVYGIIYDIQGNTASSLNFFATDSVSHFLSGSLYFNVQPNKDSLTPAIEFFGQDVEHLISTLTWD
jgi:gliding motility-associated lipoprotein GldD